VLLSLAASATTVLLAPPFAHADVPECTDADRSHGSGLQIANGQASITFTLARDCAIGLTAYEVHGKDQTKFDTAVAETAGTHTLTVSLPPCYQVDFHQGAVHTRGEGKAIRYAKDCNEVPPPVTVAPTTTPSTVTTTAPLTLAPTPTTPIGIQPEVLPAVIYPAAAAGELPATGREWADWVAVALLGIGLGTGALVAGHRRRSILES
jgi:hypothetical protein